jgi:hemerythrin
MPLEDQADVQVAIDADHHALAKLIEKVAEICKKEGGCLCEDCSVTMMQICETTFDELSTKMLCLMIEHFEREDHVMSKLPATRDMQHHCEGHRIAHTEMTCKYNRMISERHQSNLATCIHEFEGFVLGWTRGHALRYDAELARLLPRN